MASALLSIWPLYLVGSVIVFLGFLALHTWIRGLSGKGPDQPSSILAASLVAFLIGSATIAITIGIDQAQTTGLNTRSLVYHVEVHIRGSTPVRMVLPAPGEPLFFAPLNVTNGTSSLQINRTANDTSVVLVAMADVSFDVRAQIVSPDFNETLTHVSPLSGPRVLNANVTIRMTADGTGATTVDLVLQIQIVESCRFKTLLLAGTVQEGVADYPGTLAVAVC